MREGGTKGEREGGMEGERERGTEGERDSMGCNLSWHTILDI